MKLGSIWTNGVEKALSAVNLGAFQRPAFDWDALSPDHKENLQQRFFEDHLPRNPADIGVGVGIIKVMKGHAAHIPKNPDPKYSQQMSDRSNYNRVETDPLCIIRLGLNIKEMQRYSLLKSDGTLHPAVEEGMELYDFETVFLTNISDYMASGSASRKDPTEWNCLGQTACALSLKNQGYNVDLTDDEKVFVEYLKYMGLVDGVGVLDPLFSSILDKNKVHVEYKETYKKFLNMPSGTEDLTLV